jgi:hypothetical protein
MSWLVLWFFFGMFSKVCSSICIVFGVDDEHSVGFATVDHQASLLQVGVSLFLLSSELGGFWTRGSLSVGLQS